MKITFTANNTVLTATLADNRAAQDFYQMLPLELELSDYAGAEKIAYLPQKLNVSQAPSGVAANIGDINYYAPWGNLAIFYHPHGKAQGLVHLGKFDGDFSAILTNEKTAVRIERVE
ncbi:cyclophilin-like protein [Cricetibacter osteomyelitidis]|uniref:Cyclophilin-like protein n=1 Tax=Cricetibacter osteomyelitidis TaxID=1521931 RepID=A0A4R2T580_9PAST|nr:cyclophilin-like fold protein [Cricetibacter osteomyelitidis]TCP90082.1 cyclophilin-like protein [Cricetibacter osteomyelitidis]